MDAPIVLAVLIGCERLSAPVTTGFHESRIAALIHRINPPADLPGPFIPVPCFDRGYRE